MLSRGLLQASRRGLRLVSNSTPPALPPNPPKFSESTAGLALQLSFYLGSLGGIGALLFKTNRDEEFRAQLQDTVPTLYPVLARFARVPFEKEEVKQHTER